MKKRDQLELWMARRLRSAADSLSVVMSDLGDVVAEARRPRTLMSDAARDEAEALLREIEALRRRVRDLSPLPIADEE